VRHFLFLCLVSCVAIIIFYTLGLTKVQINWDKTSASRTVVGTLKSKNHFSRTSTTSLVRPLFFYSLTFINSHPGREMRQDRALPGTGSTNLEGLIKLSDMGDDADEQEDCQPGQEDHDSEREGRNSEQEDRDSEREDQNSKREDQTSEQEVTEASEPEEGTLTLDYLSDRVGWPRWFKDGIEHLEIISTVGAWSTLLSSFVKLEKKLGFADAVSKLFIEDQKLPNIILGKD
jgi:hypothetical protein